MAKLRILKAHMRQALKFYNEQVHAFVGFRFPTPALNYQVQEHLKHVQEQQQARENNPVWHVPVTALVIPESMTYVVDIADETNLLYLDFDA